ncbi:glycosyl hydrolase family 28 protein [Celerinatantimonas yamalensis]|uniref:Glycosyl hydrolase family 28 protein n=1 Tax=Celerinatantimonas yamalensis TaxID=559956 RepID=A0ABW9GC30_9GAMM
MLHQWLALPKTFVGFATLWLPCLAMAAPVAPSQVQIPSLAFDDQSVVVTWQVPTDIRHIRDYQIIENGKVIATAQANNATYAASAPYIKAFYQQDSDHFATPIVWQSATITGLLPKHHYQFAVQTIDDKGEISPLSQSVTVTTTARPTTLSVKSYGALGDGNTLDTSAIQKAINACPKNCKLVIPAGTYRTGALFLKSDMTLYLAKGATLLGSSRAQDYPPIYKLYPYSKTMRPASLINAIDPNHHVAGTFKNIRIVGQGTIDGNGWKTVTKTYTDTLGQMQPHYPFSGRERYQRDGILAKNQVDQALKNGMSLHLAYGQMRSSLMTLRGVDHLYISGITIKNPAYHGLMVLTSRHIVINSIYAQTYDANNGDGVELGNSQDAQIFNSYFDTGDDSINFAAGTGKLAKSQPKTEQVQIFNDFFHHGHGAVVLGSHTGAGIANISAQNSVVDGSNIGLRIKSTTSIGGSVQNISFNNIAMKNVSQNALTVTLKYSDPNASIDYPAATVPVSIGHIQMNHVSMDTITGNDPSINIQGEKQHAIWYDAIDLNDVKLRRVSAAFIEDLKNSNFTDVRFSNSKQPWHVQHVHNVTINGHLMN